LATTFETGDAGEYLVLSDLIRLGFSAYPVVNKPYDIILEYMDVFLKIQVKTVPRVNRGHSYLFDLRHSCKGKKSSYSEHVDLFALVALDINRIAYLPSSKKWLSIPSPFYVNNSHNKKSFDDFHLHAILKQVYEARKLQD
jgi:hypothetical protein